MAVPVVDGVSPSPVVIPAGGTVAVTVTAHMTAVADDPGTFELRFTPAGGAPEVLFTANGTIDNPEAGPVPWADVALVPVSLPGVTVVNNGDGTYVVSHAA